MTFLRCSGGQTRDDAGRIGSKFLKVETRDGAVLHDHAASDQQIADVLTYVRNNFGNKASAVTATEVKAIRAKTK